MSSFCRKSQDNSLEFHSFLEMEILVLTKDLISIDSFTSTGTCFISSFTKFVVGLYKLKISSTTIELKRPII